jgi:alpha-ketoglutarate-dependent 2,4-dichlorophenoxyacetate dioxygenase
MKDKIEPLVANNSLIFNRKTAAPEFYEGVDPVEFGFSRHKIAVPHPESGRKTLYLTSYCHHFDGMSFEDSQRLIEELFAHATQPKYTNWVKWENDHDLVVWDNTAVLHRAQAGGAYTTKYPRDMRRTSLYDAGPYGHGENDPNAPFRQGINPLTVKSGGTGKQLIEKKVASVTVEPVLSGAV